LGIAVGNLYPQLQQANGAATYTSASKNSANTAAGDLSYREYSVGANVGWELDFWGRFRRAIESADANLLASIAAYDNALVLLVAQVAPSIQPPVQPFGAPRPARLDRSWRTST
jgi:outer membrane protein TolC